MSKEIGGSGLQRGRVPHICRIGSHRCIRSRRKLVKRRLPARDKAEYCTVIAIVACERSADTGRCAGNDYSLHRMEPDDLKAFPPKSSFVCSALLARELDDGIEQRDRLRRRAFNQIFPIDHQRWRGLNLIVSGDLAGALDFLACFV